jgi:hypothetical protein
VFNIPNTRKYQKYFASGMLIGKKGSIHKAKNKVTKDE